jgi:hypothetical protein
VPPAAGNSSSSLTSDRPVGPGGEDSIRNLTGGKAKRLPAPVNGGSYRIVDADELAKLKAHGIKVKVWLP